MLGILAVLGTLALLQGAWRPQACTAQVTPITAEAAPTSVAVAHFAKAIGYESGGDRDGSVLLANLKGYGNPDMVVTTCCTLGVLINKGDGTFASAVVYGPGGYGIGSFVIADVNGDGVPDLILANVCQSSGDCNGGYNPGGVSILLGNGYGTFQTAVTYSSGGYDANSVAVADVNGDGYADVVVSNMCLNSSCESGGVSVLLGNGNGTFQAPLSYSSGGVFAYSLTIVELTSNGHLDLMLANQCESNSTCAQGEFDPSGLAVLLGNGDGTFQEAVSYSSGGYGHVSFVPQDVNHDGIPDVVAADECQDSSCETGVVSVFLGDGKGAFQGPVEYSSAGFSASSIVIRDVNGDDKEDLIVTNTCERRACDYGPVEGEVSVFFGNGDGTFQTPVGYYSGAYVTSSVSIGDVNGDGYPDLVLSNDCPSHINCTNGVVTILLGSGNGTFASPIRYGSGGAFPQTVTIEDVNGDGKPDLITANICTTGTPQGSCTNSSGDVGVLLNVLTYTTTTSLTSSSNPALTNQPITFSASIISNPSIANGEVVTFYNGAKEIGTGATINGVAAFTTSFPTAATYTIKASYAGDTFHKVSSGVIKQVVNP